jgi:hypothetical protein
MPRSSPVKRRFLPVLIGNLMVIAYNSKIIEVQGIVRVYELTVQIHVTHSSETAKIYDIGNKHRH